MRQILKLINRTPKLESATRLPTRAIRSDALAQNMLHSLEILTEYADSMHCAERARRGYIITEPVWHEMANRMELLMAETQRALDEIRLRQRETSGNADLFSALSADS